MGENSNNWHFDILLFEMLFVSTGKDSEAEDGEENDDHVVELAASLPCANLCWVGLRIVVVDSCVQPVSVVVNVELLEVSELIEWVMLQVVCDDHIIVSGRCFILISVLS